jgi:hypothetical protein
LAYSCRKKSLKELFYSKKNPIDNIKFIEDLVKIIIENTENLFTENISLISS